MCHRKDRALDSRHKLLNLMKHLHTFINIYVHFLLAFLINQICITLLKETKNIFRNWGILLMLLKMLKHLACWVFSLTITLEMTRKFLNSFYF